MSRVKTHKAINFTNTTAVLLRLPAAAAQADVSFWVNSGSGRRAPQTSKMTHLCHSTPHFAARHNAKFFPTERGRLPH